MYIAGSNSPADYMSRHPLRQSKQTSREEKVAEKYINFLADVVIPKAMTLEEVKLATQADATLQVVLEAIRLNSWHKTVDTSVNKQQFEAYKRIQSELSMNHAESIILRQRRIIIATTSHAISTQRTSRITQNEITRQRESMVPQE